LDNGEKIVKDGKYYKQYKWQINRNAENPTLREMAKKGSHKVWAEGDLPISSDDTVRQLSSCSMIWRQT